MSAACNKKRCLEDDDDLETRPEKRGLFCADAEAEDADVVAALHARLLLASEGDDLASVAALWRAALDPVIWCTWDTSSMKELLRRHVEWAIEGMLDGGAAAAGSGAFLLWEACCRVLLATLKFVTDPCFLEPLCRVACWSTADVVTKCSLHVVLEVLTAAANILGSCIGPGSVDVDGDFPFYDVDMDALEWWFKLFDSDTFFANAKAVLARSPNGEEQDLFFGKCMLPTMSWLVFPPGRRQELREALVTRGVHGDLCRALTQQAVPLKWTHMYLRAVCVLMPAISKKDPGWSVWIPTILELLAPMFGACHCDVSGLDRVLYGFLLKACRVFRATIVNVRFLGLLDTMATSLKEDEPVKCRGCWESKISVLLMAADANPLCAARLLNAGAISRILAAPLKCTKVLRDVLGFCTKTLRSDCGTTGSLLLQSPTFAGHLRALFKEKNCVAEVCALFTAALTCAKTVFTPAGASWNDFSHGEVDGFMKDMIVEECVAMGVGLEMVMDVDHGDDALRKIRLVATQPSGFGGVCQAWLAQVQPACLLGPRMDIWRLLSHWMMSRLRLWTGYRIVEPQLLPVLTQMMVQADKYHSFEMECVMSLGQAALQPLVRLAMFGPALGIDHRPVIDLVEKLLLPEGIKLKDCKRAAIQDFVSRHFAREEEDAVSRADMCPVCFQEHVEDMRRLPCHHRCCKVCVVAWMNAKVHSLLGTQCPVCRVNIVSAVKDAMLLADEPVV